MISYSFLDRFLYDFESKKIILGSRPSFQITALTCIGHKLLIGTSTGHVAIMDSKTSAILQFLHWHKDRVCTLLAMPRQVEPCICAEIPFPEPEDTSQTGQLASSHSYSYT